MSRQLFFFGTLGATTIQGRQLFKGGNYWFFAFIKHTWFELLSHLINIYCLAYIKKNHFLFFRTSATRKSCPIICDNHSFEGLKGDYYLLSLKLNKWIQNKLVNLKCTCFFWNLRCDNYSRETTIQGSKLLTSKTFLVRQVFKGDNYSREETIRGNTVLHFILFFVIIIMINRKSINRMMKAHLLRAHLSRNMGI